MIESMRRAGSVATAAGLLLTCAGCGNTGFSLAATGGQRSFAALSCDPGGLIVRAWGVDYPAAVSLRLLIVVTKSGRAWRTADEARLRVEGDGTWDLPPMPISAQTGSYSLDVEIYKSSSDQWVAGASSSCRR
jgi:hypothetical protein